MKITAGLQQQLFNRPEALRPAEDSARELTRLLGEDGGADDVGEAGKEAKVLSLGEKNTLHALFGTEKPTEYSLYGRNKIQNIHKGQLLDVRA